jgi:hydroxypyruvate isomerase
MISRRETLALGAGIAVAALGRAAAQSGARDPRLDAYAVNPEAWWEDVPLLERFELAARAGFGTVELWAVRGDDRSPGQIAARLADNGLNVTQILAWYGPGLTDRSQHPAFLEAMKQAVEDADTVGAGMFTVVGHQDDPSLALDEKVSRLREAYEAALPIMEDGGKTMLLEPFNEFNHPGHFIYGSVEALELCRTVNSPHLKLNWDLFHMQRHEGELVQRFRDGIDQVGYVQLADTPDRHQPGTGELNYAYIFREIRTAGYTGQFGLECWPQDGDVERAVQDVIAVAPPRGA